MYRALGILVIIVALGLVFGGIGFAETAAQPEKAVIEAQSDSQESIELTGTVLSDNTFVDEDGENYQLAASEKNEELLEHVGQKIKLTATVMESDEGDRNISVINYELIQE